MRSSRVFTTASLLLMAAGAFACGPFITQSRDNMIYRLVEDVSPYYHYEDYHFYHYEPDTSTDNLKLWRQQTGTRLSDDSLKWYVYESSLEDLLKQENQATRHFGKDGYRLLVIAKECEQFRNYINDPWYYPCKEDSAVVRVNGILQEARAYQGRYASRYALQIIRLLVSTHRNQEAVAYWEGHGRKLPHNVIWKMAERHVARAYLSTGDTLTAATIYARHGDLQSLQQCGLDEERAWKVVYENSPDSRFFESELQYLLTHLDNRYYDYYVKGSLREKKELKTIDMVLDLSDRVIREHRVKDMGMWYYAKAALLDLTGRESEALAAVKEGEKWCEPGSFRSNSMRILRMFIEAKTCPYDSHYEQRLYHDLRWLDDNGRKNLTKGIRRKFFKSYYYDDVVYENKYYWSDALNRILVDALAPRLKAEGHTTEALLYANLGVFWIMTNVYGEPDSPNDWGIYTTTNLSNAMVSMADTCSASDLIRVYHRIANPSRGIDHLVARYGRADQDYWADMIGTHYIAERKYALAARWLRKVSLSHQRQISTWDYYNRDPFCPKIGWNDDHRHHNKNRYDYKLRYARVMARLENLMKSHPSADERGKAMIRYGIGLRNQNDWCWALSRYYDTYYYPGMDNQGREPRKETDICDGEKFINDGITALESHELKAYYLHLFARNKEVMDLYPDTKIAKNMRLHCDLWRNYKKK